MSEELIDYGAWGERFFATAVTTERVLAGVNVLAGRPIDVGPMGVGPGRLVKVSAKGRIGHATGERSGGNPITFRIELPVDLEFFIDFGMDKQHFDAQVSVPLHIAARGRDDLAIVLDVTPPAPAEVVVRLTAQGVRASLTGRVANIDGELRRFIAKYVAREIDQPTVRAATVIDVAGAIDRAAGGVVPK